MYASGTRSVSMPSRAYTSFLQSRCDQKYVLPGHRVSMPSRAYTSFLHIRLFMIVWQRRMGVNALSGLYLISTWCNNTNRICSINKCQCPLGLIPHFYERNPMLYKTTECFVSMPSRAYTSFLQYPFKNLGFMRFPEPVFAGIYQNILTAAVFRAC